MSRFMAVYVVFAVNALLCALPLQARAAEPEKVVAVVNGAALFSAELEQEVMGILPENRSFHGQISTEKMKKIRSEALQKLVNAELQFQDAVAKGMKVSPDELKSELGRLSAGFKSKKEFQTAIEISGFSEKSFDRFVERMLLSARVRKAEVDDKIAVTDALVKAKYAENEKRYSKPQEYRASHILIKVDPSAAPEDRVALRTKADGILKRLRAGEDFASIASNESDDMSRINGGDLGAFHAGQLVSEVDSVLEKMKVGEISDVIESIYGYHIIKLTERRPQRQIPIEEVQDKIRKELIDAEKTRLSEQWMTTLKAKAVITYPGEK